MYQVRMINNVVLGILVVKYVHWYVWKIYIVKVIGHMSLGGR